MKIFFVPACVFLGVFWAPAASAQVTINPAALIQLAGIPTPPPPHAPSPIKRAVFIQKKTIAKPAAPAPAKIIPAVAKPAPSLTAPPPTPKPLRPITLTFAPGSAALPAGAAAALSPYCAAPGQVAIDAHAPADPDDMSAAMRLSLSRALAVRDALAACGVAGTRILPRADGAVPGANENQAVIGIPGAK